MPADWLQNEPEGVQDYIRRHVTSERKCRLFAVSMCRHWWNRIPNAGRELVELAERFADGGVTANRLRRVRTAVFRMVHAAWHLPGWPKEWVSHWAAYHTAVPRILPPCSGYFLAEAHLTSDAAHLTVAGDIFADPACPVAFDPGWRTSTVVALASQMYESRDFAPMPILADALQDAGCETDDILNHCRGGGVHVRGCWVVDLVLEKA